MLLHLVVRLVPRSAVSRCSLRMVKHLNVILPLPTRRSKTSKLSRRPMLFIFINDYLIGRFTCDEEKTAKVQGIEFMKFLHVNSRAARTTKGTQCLRFTPSSPSVGSARILGKSESADDFERIEH